MKKIFADTGYWIALLNPDDDLHPKARNMARSLKNVSIVTSEISLLNYSMLFRERDVFIEKKL